MFSFRTFLQLEQASPSQMELWRNLSPQVVLDKAIKLESIRIVTDGKDIWFGDGFHWTHPAMDLKLNISSMYVKIGNNYFSGRGQIMFRDGKFNWFTDQNLETAPKINKIYQLAKEYNFNLNI